MIALAWELDAYSPVLAAVIAAGMFGRRLLALRRGWRRPRAIRRALAPDSG